MNYDSDITLNNDSNISSFFIRARNRHTGIETMYLTSKYNLFYHRWGTDGLLKIAHAQFMSTLAGAGDSGKQC